MYHRNLYKARGRLCKNTLEVSQARIAQRAIDRNNLRSTQRNISPVDEVAVSVPVPKMRRIDRLKQWRAERDLKKQAEAAMKRKPFITVVKSGVFLEKPNYTEINKQLRQKSKAKEMAVNAKKPILNTRVQVMTNENHSVSSELPSHYGPVQTFEVLNAAEGDVTVGFTGIIPTENEASKLNSTFKVLTSSQIQLEETYPVNDATSEALSSEPSQTTENINQSLKPAVTTLPSTSLNCINPFMAVSGGTGCAQERDASVSNVIQEMIEVASEKQENKKAPATSSSAFSGSNYSIVLLQTPARHTSIIPKTLKNIMKTPASRRITKNVVFFGINCSSEMESTCFSTKAMPKASLTLKSPFIPKVSSTPKVSLTLK